jgi:hypothetical protein
MVGGGLLAGGILAGTVNATAAEDTTPTPSVTQEEGTTGGTAAPEDCPEGGGGPRGDEGTALDDSTTPESTTPESGA